MQKNEKEPGYTFEQQVAFVEQSLADAEHLLKKEKKRIATLSALSLVEHHIGIATPLAKRMTHQEKLRKWRKRAKRLRQQCGLLSRIIAYALQL